MLRRAPAPRAAPPRRIPPVGRRTPCASGHPSIPGLDLTSQRRGFLFLQRFFCFLADEAWCFLRRLQAFFAPEPGDPGVAGVGGVAGVAGGSSQAGGTTGGVELVSL